MALAVDKEDVDRLGLSLNNTHVPLKERFRALFTLRNINGEDCIKWIGKCFSDESALLKHECAYCLGQMQDERAIPLLLSVLANMEQEPMTRHEAGEALGAIGVLSEEVEAALKKFSEDDLPEVSETCQLALSRLKWLADGGKPDAETPTSPYHSVDPTPAAANNDVAALTLLLLDEQKPLFERYTAMFSLRNLGTEQAILALAKGLEGSSALFRHEIAYVLGQTQHAAGAEAMLRHLADPSENPMVRHECAEALGALGKPEVDRALAAYLQDPERVVRESCEVALDMSEHVTSSQFQYADGLGDHTADS